jgi:hypothetical protein
VVPAAAKAATLVCTRKTEHLLRRSNSAREIGAGMHPPIRTQCMIAYKKSTPKSDSADM